MVKSVCLAAAPVEGDPVASQVLWGAGGGQQHWQGRGGCAFLNPWGGMCASQL